jgi:hypothetical protein
MSVVVGMFGCGTMFICGCAAIAGSLLRTWLLEENLQGQSGEAERYVSSTVLAIKISNVFKVTVNEIFKLYILNFVNTIGINKGDRGIRQWLVYLPLQLLFIAWTILLSKY